MKSIAEMVTELGGMAQKQDLVRLGASDRDLTLAVKEASVIRARQGWYTTSDRAAASVRAVRVGGRLTGLSALTEMGAWMFGMPPLHVSMRRNSSRMRSQWNRRVPLPEAARRVHLHWDDDGIASRGTATSVSMEDALLRVILDESLVSAVAALDWAIHSGRLDRIGLEMLVLRLPVGLQGIVGWVDPNCGSFLESVGRTQFRMHGLAVTSQVPVGGAKSIDLVIEDTVAIETDGKKYHRDTFDSDRLKDLDISLAGLHAMRPSAHIVLRQWPRLLRAVDIALAARGVVASGSPADLPARGRRSRSRDPRVRARPLVSETQDNAVTPTRNLGVSSGRRPEVLSFRPGAAPS